MLTAAVVCACYGQDVRLELRCDAPPARFHSGEVIPVELAFTSRTPKHYQLNMALRDRSGRTWYDTFSAAPSGGTRDPLAVYFGSAGGFILGGAVSFQFLSETPISVRLDLNEFLSIDRPGRYEVSVTSRRVSQMDGDQMNLVETKSNSCEIEVVAADPEWQRARLEEIRRGLDAKQPEAVKALRYLGSEEAAREMARRLRGEDPFTDWDFGFGLVGTTHRRAALAEMESLVRSPDFPISEIFLRFMSMLDIDPATPREQMYGQRQANLERIRGLLFDSLSAKRGKARAVTLDTALRSGPPPRSEEVRRKMAAQVIHSFEALPLQTRISYLKERWDLVRGPQMLPLLRRVARQYEDFPEPRETRAYQTLELTGAALTRWYELDPEGARAAILDEIRRPRPRYSASLLGMLPDKALPDVEAPLADTLTTSGNLAVETNAGSLLARYGTAASLPRVLAWLDGAVGKWACAPQNAALAFVLKTDPEAARPLLNRALDARSPGDNYCRSDLLSDVSSMHTDPVLEEIAIRRLADADLQVVRDAANYLGKHGSASAEEPLLRRYEEWCALPGEQPGLNLGHVLAQAVAAARGWVTDEAKLRRMLALAPEKSLRLQIESWLTRAVAPLGIVFIPTDPPQYDIAQYSGLSPDALSAKLVQFPKGTAFRWTLGGNDAENRQEKAFAEITRFAAKEGYSVQR